MFNWITWDQVDTITGIVSKIAIVGVFFQLLQIRNANRAAFKDNFIACTARYAKIQELLLSNDDLAHLNRNIYEKEIREEKPDRNIFYKERALCGIMFQLMEDVWVLHNFDKHDKEAPFWSRFGFKDMNKDVFDGWNALFEDWMLAPIITDHWVVLRAHYSRDFRTFVDKNYPQPVRKS